jgi:fucose 4-O-acetylase-like acetyltransferase
MFKLDGFVLWYLVFMTVLLVGYVYVRVQAYQTRVPTWQAAVDLSYPGYTLYANVWAAALMRLLNIWVNWRYRCRSVWSTRPDASWFPQAVTFRSSDDTHSELSAVRFSAVLCPHLLSYDWYRSYTIHTSTGSCIIFAPWVWPQETRPHVFLFQGDISMGTIVWQFLKGAMSNGKK